MSIVAKPPVANAAVALRAREEIRLRPDLQWIEQVRARESTWFARDPLTLEYYYFSNIEKEFLMLLDQHRSLDAVLEMLKTSSINRQWAELLLARLNSMGLLIRQGELNRGQRLWKQAKKQTNALMLDSLLNPLSVRVKLWDPNKVIKHLGGLSWLLLNRWTFLIVAMVVPIFAWLVLLRLASNGFGVLQDATIHWNWQMGLQLMLAYALVKSLHELGHALACRYHGASCHEMGVLFLLFVPCLYCDTSDSWRLSSRWRRAAIAAAGIYVEFIVGMLAGLIWLSTHTHSVLHQICAYILVSATISTLMVNANPLMRYDGYYVLSDLWGVPNLSQQSISALRTKFASLFFGAKAAHSTFDASPWLLAGYALAAKIYQALAMGMIVIAAWTLMDQAGFRLGGVILLGLLLARFIAGYVTEFRNLVRVAFSQSWRNTIRAAIVTCFLTAVSYWGLFCVELPTWVSSRGVCELEHLTPVFASETGTLVYCIDVRKPINKGELIAQLGSVKFELEIQQLDGEIHVFRELLEQLQLESIIDDQAAGKIGEVAEQISKHSQRRSMIAEQLANMNIVAQQSGMFIPSSTQAPMVLSQGSDRSAWRPILERENLGCTIERGTMLGWIAPLNGYNVVAYVDQSDLETIALEMKARVRLDGFADQVLEGVVTKIMPDPLSQSPSPLVGDESFVSQSAFDGKLTPNVPHYEVQIRLIEQPTWLVHQNVATVHIATTPRSLWNSMVRQFELNVRPKLLL